MEFFPLGILVFLLFLLILVSAFFSGSEIGMMSLNRYRLRHLMREKNKSAIRVHKLLERPDRLLGVILIGNTFANIIASAIATIIGQRLWGDVGVMVATVSLTLIILIFAEMTPKTLAAMYPQRVAFTVSLALNALLYLMAPFVWITSRMANALLRLFGVKIQKGVKEGLSGEELRSVVNEAGSLIPSKHKKMLLSILELESVTVEDIMVPRGDIVGIDMGDPHHVILEQLETAQHTRLPLYKNDIDGVMGVIHIRTILNLLVDDSLDKTQIKALAEAPYFIPEGTPLHRQLVNFQQQKKRSGFVVDEYGMVQGLVTLEDILEEIVGEFTTDMAASSKDILSQEDGSYLVDGSAAIRELNRTMGWQLPAIGPRTLSGLITETLGFIPPAQSCLKINGYPMEVMQVKDNMVKTVKVTQA